MEECPLCAILAASKPDMKKLEAVSKTTGWDDYCEDCRKRLCDLAASSSAQDDLTEEVLASLLSDLN